MRMFYGNRSIPFSLVKFVCSCLFCAFSLTLLPAVGSAASAEMNKINRERHRVERTLKDLKKQLSEYQSRLNSTKKNERRSIADLNNLRKQIKVYERLITENQTLLGSLDKEIDQLQDQLQENRQTYHHVSSDFQRVVVAAYKHGGDRNAELMFSSGSVNGAIVRSRYMGFLSRSVSSKVSDLQSSAQVMESSREQLQESYREKEEAMKSQQKELQSYSSKQKEKEEVLNGIRKDKKTYAAQISGVRKKQRAMQAKIESLIMAQQELIRKEQERARLEALRRQRLAEARRRRAAERERLKRQAQRETPPPARSEEVPGKPSRQAPAIAEKSQEEPPAFVDFTESEIDRVSVDFDKGGSLPWPVSNGVVVRRFGASRDKELNIVTISNGIDISVPVGTAVKSVSGGKVVQVTYLPTFGNVVIVRHPKSYLTVYANLGRVSVAEGEIIRSRQLLGSSVAMPEGGSTVHFEVWKGKIKQNPQKWLR
ncbi:murein hydrolase activator EnvC [Chlorobaculum sp. 24CR]|uniref:murein hydrolase activator EnvC family protein n=1 Tax=Chlorobaculum sp. 24CR TaxID=2508878 RepID=UPI001FD64453|nr:peptidoglycan DD-metalloendopeptidase family protein [Chlorobaculum sp. 24CR]